MTTAELSKRICRTVIGDKVTLRNGEDGLRLCIMSRCAWKMFENDAQAYWELVAAIHSYYFCDKTI